MNGIKRGMLKVAVAAVVASGSVVLVSSALAGSTSTDFVEINYNYMYARGALGNAHNSTDQSQSIGCYVTAGYASCSAVDASWNFVYCYTNNPALVSIAASISGDSFVRFYFNNSSECTEIDVANYSGYPSKNH